MKALQHNQAVYDLMNGKQSAASLEDVGAWFDKIEYLQRVARADWYRWQYDTAAGKADGATMPAELLARIEELQRLTANGPGGDQ